MPTQYLVVCFRIKFKVGEKGEYSAYRNDNPMVIVWFMLVQSQKNRRQVRTIFLQIAIIRCIPFPAYPRRLRSIVELISGPFKGEKAKVVRIDESREDVVLELIEAAVPIPVTVKGDQIRLIQKEAD